MFRSIGRVPAKGGNAGVGMGVEVGVVVGGAGVAVTVAVGNGVEVEDGVAVAVAMGVGVLIASVTVGSTVGVGVGVCVGVGVAVGVLVAVGVGVGVGSATLSRTVDSRITLSVSGVYGLSGPIRVSRSVIGPEGRVEVSKRISTLPFSAGFSSLRTSVNVAHPPGSWLMP